jgi:peptidoglycan biosynthesis protein MviN/MurJ (putative lipid II flippase)
MSTRNNALAYGYSITSTTSFAVLERTAGSASVGHIFLFVLGAGIAFAGVTALVTRGFRSRVEQEPPMVVALGTSLSVISISAGVGIAALVGLVIQGAVAWLLGAILATWTYLGVAALEIAAARLLHIGVGERDPEER